LLGPLEVEIYVEVTHPARTAAQGRCDGELLPWDRSVGRKFEVHNRIEDLESGERHGDQQKHSNQAEQCDEEQRED
jgi:hypothetical protein